MTIEEIYAGYKLLIKVLTRQSSYSEDEIKAFMKVIWDEGYKFRINEEVTNKGASF
jgi:hypothetical protein